MPFIPTAHAEDRFRERIITQKDIEFCLKNHHITLEEVCGVHLYIANHPNGKRIQVTIDTKNNQIMSAVWLE
jgi:hypothetical protein